MIVWVQEKVRSIAAMRSDFEVAHAREDSLLEQVLRAIADGHPEPVKLAKEALKVKEIEFPRMFA